MPTTIDLSNLPLVTNKAFYPLYSDDSRYLVLMGGGGSGKSVFAAEKVVVRMMNEPEHFAIAVRKVARTLKASVIAQMKSAISLFGVSELWHENKEDHTLTFIPNGNVFMGLGLDDPEKIKSIVSDRNINITIAWLEEATELSEQDFIQIGLRMRGKTKNYRQTILTFNPVFHRHWLRKKFFDQIQPDAKVVVTTYKDNEFLDEAYKASLEALKDSDETMWLIYAKGEWGVIKGVIFRPWQVVEKAPDEPDETIYGLDFGWNQPSALIRIDIHDGEYYFTEVLYEPRYTTEGIIAFMESVGVSYSDIIYPDSAEPDRIDTLSRSDFSVIPQQKGAGSVKLGIDWMRANQKYFHVVAGSQNLINENQTYKYKEKNGEVLDEPLQINDHAMDAIRCALYTHTAASVPFTIS